MDTQDSSSAQRLKVVMSENKNHVEERQAKQFDKQVWIVFGPIIATGLIVAGVDIVRHAIVPLFH